MTVTISTLFADRSCVVCHAGFDGPDRVHCCPTCRCPLVEHSDDLTCTRHGPAPCNRTAARPVERMNPHGL